MKKILVINEDLLILQMMIDMLQNADLAATLATDGCKALDILKTNSIDLIILDMMMEMNGFKVIHYARRSHTPAELPIIMLTSETNPGALVKAFELGCNDYLPSPFGREELLTRVHLHLELQEMQKLREKIEKGKKMEKLLVGLLEVEKKAILVLNAENRINFVNQGASDFFKMPLLDMQGKPLENIISDKSLGFLNEALLSSASERQDNEDNIRSVLIPYTINGERRMIETLISGIDTGDETKTVLIFRPIEQPVKHDPITLSSNLESEVEKGKQKIKVLEDAFENVSRFFKESRNTIDHLDQIVRVLQHSTGDRANNTDELRKMAVAVMQHALKYWQLSTQKDKLCLAEESGLWRISQDDIYQRARTLDKYLNIKTLPKNPRWRRIIETADYVLKNSPPIEPQRQHLQFAVTKMKSRLNRPTH